MKTVLLASWLLASTAAFPTRAGSCPAGRAAPPLGHGPGRETLLAERDFEFAIQNSLTVGEAATVTLTAKTTAIPFRGFLIRLATGDGVLEPTGPEVQIASVCGDVPGLTQTSADSKLFIEATVIPMAAGPLVFDVSVVESNNAVEGNVYSYESFAFQVVQAGVTGEPTAAPITSTPTASPSAEATKVIAMVPRTTAFPTFAPEVKTDEPTMAPVTTPSPTASPSVEAVTLRPLQTFAPLKEDIIITTSHPTMAPLMTTVPTASPLAEATTTDTSSTTPPLNIVVPTGSPLSSNVVYTNEPTEVGTLYPMEEDLTTKVPWLLEILLSWFSAPFRWYSVSS